MRSTPDASSDSFLPSSLAASVIDRHRQASGCTAGPPLSQPLSRGQALDLSINMLTKVAVLVQSCAHTS